MDVGQIQRGEGPERLQQLLGVHLFREAPQVEQPQPVEPLEAKVRLQGLARGGDLVVLVLGVLVAGQRSAALPVEDVAAAEQAERHQRLLEAAQRLQAARRQAVTVGEVELDQVLQEKTKNCFIINI